jgi:hypothetical protein
MNKTLIILFLGLLYRNSSTFASDKILSSLEEGGKLIFIRHAVTPGNGDPDNFHLKNMLYTRQI